jgi:hypothetical protein
MEEVRPIFQIAGKSKGELKRKSIREPFKEETKKKCQSAISKLL